MGFILHTLPIEKFEALPDCLDDRYSLELNRREHEDGSILRSYKVKRGLARLSVNEFPHEEGDDPNLINIYIRNVGFNPLRFRSDARLYKDLLHDLAEHGLEEVSMYDGEQQAEQDVALNQ